MDFIALLPFLAALSTTACVGEEETSAVDQPLMAENSLTSNALTASSLTESARMSEALTGGALRASVMDVLGDCPEVCGKPRRDGSYPACGPDKHTRFLGSVTVFRR